MNSCVDTSKQAAVFRSFSCVWQPCQRRGPSLRPEGMHGAHRLKGRHALLEKTGETSNGAAGDGRVSPGGGVAWWGRHLSKQCLRKQPYRKTALPNTAFKRDPDPPHGCLKIRLGLSWDARPEMGGGWSRVTGMCRCGRVPETGEGGFEIKP